MVDVENNDVHQGATPLVKRCMRVYNWDLQMARKVLKAYRQFLFLKKHNEDWDAKLLSPSFLVDQMWHQHILDVVNYCHDTMLICGHVVGHNPDGAFDIDGKKSRDERTRDGLNEHFEREYDNEIWGINDVPSDAVKTNDDVQVNEDLEDSSLPGNENGIASAASGGGGMTKDADVGIVSNDEDGGEDAEDVFATIQLHLVHTGFVDFYRLHRSSRLSNCFRAFARSQRKRQGDFIFQYNGCKVDGRRTLNSLMSMGLQNDGRLFQIVVIFKDENARIAAERRAQETIAIRIKDQSGEETYFKVKRSTKFCKIFNAYASRKGVDVNSLRFLSDGDLVKHYLTPLLLELEDQDQIDAVLEQIGC
jgi:small ubiquitin-related modifier